MAIRDFVAKIQTQFDGKGVKQAESSIQGLKNALGSAKIAALGFGAALVGVAKALFEGARRGGEFAQELSLVSTGLGLGAGRARELERALNRSGQDISDLRGIMAGLNSAVGEAMRELDGPFADALRGIGLEVSTLQGRDPAGVLGAVVQAIIDLKDIDSEEFSFISQLLGDDDAVRIVTAAKDLKQALLTELTFTDEEIEQATNTGRFFSDIENAKQDAEIEAAAQAGGIGESVAASWAKPIGDFFTWLGELGRDSETDLTRRLGTIAETIRKTGGRALGAAAGVGLYQGRLKKMHEETQEAVRQQRELREELYKVATAAQTAAPSLREYIDQVARLRRFEDQLADSPGGAGGVFGVLATRRRDFGHAPESVLAEDVNRQNRAAATRERRFYTEAGVF